MVVVFGFLHPVLMAFIIAGWGYALFLGLRVRSERLPTSSPSATPLLSNELESKRTKSHHRLSASLFFLTLSGTLIGMGYNYFTEGQLYPGPHLYCGMTINLVLSFNVALVPWLQAEPKLRFFHLMLGFVVLVLCVWQVRTGVPIMQYIV